MSLELDTEYFIEDCRACNPNSQPGALPHTPDRVYNYANGIARETDNMNGLERRIHLLLENYPHTKTLCRNIYQRACSIVPTKKIIPKNMIKRPGYFFGFHNICPWSADNKLLLSHKFDLSSKHDLKFTRPIGVGYFHGENFDNYTLLAETSSWNWQQGSMLQWLGKKPSVIFNDFDGKRNHACIISKSKSEQFKLERPITTVSTDGDYALSYSFERLRIGMPGYQYLGGNEDEEQKNIPKNDGLYLLNLVSAKPTLLFSIEDIANYNPEPSFKNAYHFFTHTLFSPDGNRILFLHRWLEPGQAVKTRMLSCDFNGRDIFVFPTDRFVSHIIWVDSEHVIAYAGTPSGGRQYYIFRDKKYEYSPVGSRWFNSDGHPNLSPDKKWLITDTYPDRYRMQRLKLYDMSKDKGIDIVSLRVPFVYRDEYRCDFHPRWDRTGGLISFDAVHDNTRCHCTIDIESDKKPSIKTDENLDLTCEALQWQTVQQMTTRRLYG